MLQWLIQQISPIYIGCDKITHGYNIFMILHEFLIIILRGVAKGGPDRAQAHPNVGCALPMKIQNTLIEHSNILLKQSRALIVPCQL